MKHESKSHFDVFLVHRKSNNRLKLGAITIKTGCKLTAHNNGDKHRVQHRTFTVFHLPTVLHLLDAVKCSCCNMYRCTLNRRLFVYKAWTFLINQRRCSFVLSIVRFRSVIKELLSCTTGSSNDAVNEFSAAATRRRWWPRSITTKMGKSIHRKWRNIFYRVSFCSIEKKQIMVDCFWTTRE